MTTQSADRAPILVTGATGNVGGALLRQLSGAGVPARALVRDPTRATLPPGTEAIQGDLGDPASVGAALAGGDRVFLLWPLDGDRVGPVLDVLAGRASRVVYLSSSGVRDDGAATDPINTAHARLEGLVRASGVEWTFLRSGGMATNALGWAAQIRAERRVTWPFGDSTRPVVHEDDLGEVARHALTSEAYVGRSLVLTGPEDVSQVDQVRAIADALGEPVEWQEQDRDSAYEQMLGWGWPEETVAGALDAWAAMTPGSEPVSPAVRDVTGHDALSFDQWARDHVAAFR